MISFSQRRWVIVCIGHLFALFIVSQINHYISPLSIHITIVGMLLAFSALALNFKQGFLSILPVGLYLDSQNGLPFGSSTVMLCGLFAIIFSTRSAFQRESQASMIAVALLCNVLLFAGYSLLARQHFGNNPDLLSLLINLIASGLSVALLNHIYFNAQLQTLSFFGIHIAEEQRDAT